MRIDKKDNNQFHYYDNACDLASCVDNLPERKGGATNRRNELAEGKVNSDTSSDWYGGLTSVQQAKDLVTKGWTEGASRIKTLAESLQASIPEPTSIRRKLAWSDEGDEIDMGKVYSGQLDSCWQTTKRRSTGVAPIIKVNVPWGGHCGRDSEELFWTAAPALAIADALETAGYRVELETITEIQHRDIHNGHTEERQIIRVCLKDAHSPIDMGTLAALCCHSGVFRTLGFGAILHYDGYVNSSLGTSRKPNTPLEGITLQATLSEQQAIDECKRVFASLEQQAA